MRYVENVTQIRNGNNIEIRDGDIVIFFCSRENFYKRKVRKTKEFEEYLTKEEVIEKYPELSKIKVFDKTEPISLLDYEELWPCYNPYDGYDYEVIKRSFEYDDENERVIETRIEIYIGFIDPSYEPKVETCRLNGKVAKKKKVPKRKNKKKHKKY